MGRVGEGLDEPQPTGLVDDGLDPLPRDVERPAQRRHGLRPAPRDELERGSHGHRHAGTGHGGGHGPRGQLVDGTDASEHRIDGIGISHDRTLV